MATLRSLGRMAVTDPEALANLYPEAASYVARHWAPGRLEARSKSIRSSQALCVSVLLTLRQRSAALRSEVCAAVCEEAGLAPLGAAPDIDAEVREHRRLLGEVGGGTPTALDGLLTTSLSVLTLESKFTEPEFGSCGQIKAKKVKPPDPRFDPANREKRFANCNGMHAVGSDQKWTTQGARKPCRLTVVDGKRQPRRYWDVAPHLFVPDILSTPQQCPWATDAYQLMRNLVFAREWAMTHQLEWFGFLVMLVDAAPHASELRQRVADLKMLLRPELHDRVGVISYEHLGSILLGHGEIDLADWVKTRLAEGLHRALPLES